MIEGWSLVLCSLCLATVAAAIALPARWTRRGHPFGTRASSRLAVLSAVVVVALSTAAALLSTLIPLAAVPAKPLAIAFLLPFGASVARVGRRYLVQSQQTLGPVLLTRLVSAGAAVVLDRLDTQMALDEDEWVTGHGWGEVDPSLLLDETRTLAATLARLVHENQVRQKEIKRLLSAAERAIAASENDELDDENRARSIHKARQALLFLRGRAYEWRLHRHQHIDRPPARPLDEPARDDHAGPR